MVTINLTLFVCLGLFLSFLWLMNAFIFRPILKVMDNRDEQLAEDKQTAESASQEAETLEKDYTQQYAAMHREASHTIYHAQRVVQDAHLKKVAELRKEHDAEVAEVRAEALGQVDAERQHYPELIVQLQAEVAKQVGLERDGS